MEVCGRGCVVEVEGACSNQRRQVGHPSKQQHGGGRHHLNLPHHHTTTSKEVPLPCGHQLGWFLYVVNSAAPPMWVRGQSGGPCKENFGKGDNRVSRRSSGATEARRGSRGDFSLSLKSENDINLVLIADFLIFVSVLEKGL